jgi:rod shape determining protein RodA
VLAEEFGLRGVLLLLAIYLLILLRGILDRTARQSSYGRILCGSLDPDFLRLYLC